MAKQEDTGLPPTPLSRLASAFLLAVDRRATTSAARRAFGPVHTHGSPAFAPTHAPRTLMCRLDSEARSL